MDFGVTLQTDPPAWRVVETVAYSAGQIHGSPADRAERVGWHAPPTVTT